LIISTAGIERAIGGAEARARLDGRGGQDERRPGAPSSATKDELVAMLPASDLIAVVDIGRAFNELLPKLAGFTWRPWISCESIQDFTVKTASA